jgi:hypothetical protein
MGFAPLGAQDKGAGDCRIGGCVLACGLPQFRNNKLKFSFIPLI